MAALPSLRAARQELLADTSLLGAAWCRRWSGACDRWLAGLFHAACGPDPDGLALVAVGGYGAGELAPGSDMDVVLVHDRRRPPAKEAEALWYPVWDEGIGLDYSVRTVKELRSAMADDVKVALGLLEVRLVAGDAALAARVSERVADMWRSRAEKWLPEVAEAVTARHAKHGDVAFLLEPDLKESRGGTRDLRVLEAVGKVSPVVEGVLAEGSLRTAADVLASTRVELQRSTGKSSNRLLLQEQDVVAAALGYADADKLMLEVAGAGRTVAWASDDCWRRVESSLRGPRGRQRSSDRPVEPGLVLRDGEIALAAGTDPAADVSLPLRAAAASAELSAPLARATLDRLAARAAPVEGRWPPELLRALVRVLGAGRNGVYAIEALDQIGVWLRLLPEWEAVRNRPQRNAYHRFTVDRHLLETAAEASEMVRSVARPDLLLVAALLHDIGKGRGGDHTDIGVALTAQLAPRLGFPEADCAVLATLVRHHLLLADVATRRDLDDPRTIDAVAAAVGDAGTLELLAALTEADSRATGASAWGSWKAGLVRSLVVRTGARLAGRPHLQNSTVLSEEEAALIEAGRVQLVADGERVTVAAPDRSGLLATVAGVLALNGVTVRTASTRTERGSHMAVLAFEVAPAFDVLPAWGRVADQLTAALEGRLPLERRLEERERAYAGGHRPTTARRPEVRVDADNEAASSATVIEVRAPDTGPVLYRAARAMSEAGVMIDAAMVTTLGAEAVDAFYVTTPEGGKLGPELAADVATALRSALEA